MGQWCQPFHLYCSALKQRADTPSAGRDQHGKTGLTAACVQAEETMGDVEKRVLAYADKHFKEPKALLSGNSVHVDKQWLVSV